MGTIKQLSPIIVVIVIFSLCWVYNPWRQTNFLGTIGYTKGGQTYPTLSYEEDIIQKPPNVAQVKQWLREHGEAVPE